MADRPLTCALLTYWRYWPGEALLACPGLEVVALNPNSIGYPEDRNPFGLPEADHADVALVSAWWYLFLTVHFPDRADRVMQEIERRADVLVGLDGPDRFSLTFAPSAFKRFEIIIKPQGFYRDRDLYNYVVGPDYDGAIWTEKARPREARYSDSDLEQLRLSLPSFVTEFPEVRRRNRARATDAGRRSAVPQSLLDAGDEVFTRAIGLVGNRGRSREVQCLTGLSHVQRIEAMRLLEGFSGTRGIAPTQGTSAELVAGTEYGGANLPGEVAEELVQAARPYFHPPMGRFRFVLDLRRHRVAFAPTGYGEIGNRHGLALMAGAALVCQDLSHVETMLRLEDRRNVAFCRPDLSDLPAVVRELLADEEQRTRIARTGRRDFMRWADGAQALLYDGLEAHIREAAGLGARRISVGSGATTAQSFEAR